MLSPFSALGGGRGKKKQKKEEEMGDRDEDGEKMIRGGLRSGR